MAVIIKLIAQNQGSTEPANVYLASLSSLILNSIIDGLNESESLSAIKLIVSNIASCLNCPLIEKLNQTALAINELTQNPEAQHQLTNCSRDLGDLLTSKRISVEILANLCSDEDDLKFEDIDDTDEMEIDGGIIDDGRSDASSEVGLTETRSLNPEVEAIINTSGVFPLICQHLDPMALEMKLQLVKSSYGREVIDSVDQLHRATLVCISNYVQCLKPDQTVVEQHLSERMLNLVKSEVKLVNSKRNLLAEAISVTRALVSDNYFSVADSELYPTLIQLITSVTDSLLIVNAIKTLGVIGSRLTDLNKIEEIATFLLTVTESVTQLERIEEIEIKSEAFDNLMDIFGEDFKTDSLVIKLDLVGRLRQSTKQFKSYLKEEERRTRRRNPIADTVASNLTRFIKYKQKSIKN